MREIYNIEISRFTPLSNIETVCSFDDYRLARGLFDNEEMI